MRTSPEEHHSRCRCSRIWLSGISVAPVGGRLGNTNRHNLEDPARPHPRVGSNCRWSCTSVVLQAQVPPHLSTDHITHMSTTPLQTWQHTTSHTYQHATSHSEKFKKIHYNNYWTHLITKRAGVVTRTFCSALTCRRSHDSPQYKQCKHDGVSHFDRWR